MNASTSVTFLLILTLGVVHVSAAETIYFLVGYPRGTDWELVWDSYVLPLTEPEDIAYARRLIEMGPRVFDGCCHPLVAARIGPGNDGTNRDYLDPTFPKWSWQVIEFLGFYDVSTDDLDGSATLVENTPDWYNGRDTRNGVIGFWRYTVVRELGPHPLYLSIIPEDQQLQFFWTGLGTNHVYMLEGSDSLTTTNWSAVPGVSWPLRTNHWVLPRSNGRTSLYRVRAEQSTSEPIPAPLQAERLKGFESQQSCLEQ